MSWNQKNWRIRVANLLTPQVIINEWSLKAWLSHLSSYWSIFILRPLSVDSLNGGSTDVLQKAPVEKKNWPKNWKNLKCHIFAPIGPTERYDSSRLILGMFVTNGSFFFLFFFFTWPTDCRKNPCEKSAIQGINRLWPYRRNNASITQVTVICNISADRNE